MDKNRHKHRIEKRGSFCIFSGYSRQIKVSIVSCQVSWMCQYHCLGLW